MFGKCQAVGVGRVTTNISMAELVRSVSILGAIIFDLCAKLALEGTLLISRDH